MPASCHCCELLLSHAIIQRIFDAFHPSKRIPMLVSEHMKRPSALNWCSDALAPHGVPASTLVRQAVPALTLFHVATQAIGTKAEKREVDAAIEDLKTQLQKVYPVHPAAAPFTSALWVAAASGAHTCGQKWQYQFKWDTQKAVPSSNPGPAMLPLLSFLVNGL
jgi:hypothetical protein